MNLCELLKSSLPQFSHQEEKRIMRPISEALEYNKHSGDFSSHRHHRHHHDPCMKYQIIIIIAIVFRAYSGAGAGPLCMRYLSPKAALSGIIILILLYRNLRLRSLK